MYSLLSVIIPTTTIHPLWGLFNQPANYYIWRWPIWCCKWSSGLVTVLKRKLSVRTPESDHQQLLLQQCPSPGVIITIPTLYYARFSINPHKAYHQTCPTTLNLPCENFAVVFIPVWKCNKKLQFANADGINTVLLKLWSKKQASMGY